MQHKDLAGAGWILVLLSWGKEFPQHPAGLRCGWSGASCRVVSWFLFFPPVLNAWMDFSLALQPPTNQGPDDSSFLAKQFFFVFPVGCDLLCSFPRELVLL